MASDMGLDEVPCVTRDMDEDYGYNLTISLANLKK